MEAPIQESSPASEMMASFGSRVNSSTGIVVPIILLCMRGSCEIRFLLPRRDRCPFVDQFEIRLRPDADTGRSRSARNIRRVSRGRRNRVGVGLSGLGLAGNATRFVAAIDAIDKVFGDRDLVVPDYDDQVLRSDVLEFREDRLRGPLLVDPKFSAALQFLDPGPR